MLHLKKINMKWSKINNNENLFHAKKIFHLYYQIEFLFNFVSMFAI